MGPQANQALMQLLGPQDEQGMQNLFQQSFVDPAMQQFEQITLPAISQRFGDANAGSSSALNQALGQSAADLSTMLGSQMGQFQQQQQQNRLGGLNALMGLGTQQMQQPMIHQQQGALGPLIGAAGQAAGAYFGAR